MYKIQRSLHVPYSSRQMFCLVAEVDKYPDFMPWCGGTEIQYFDEENVLASINIDFHGIHQRFTTHNKHYYPARIELELVEGPFSFLSGKWTFQNYPEKTCKIFFSMEYTFSLRIIELVIAPVFKNIISSFVDSFLNRADIIYGERVC